MVLAVVSEWAKVATEPLGLVGFGLFLVFGYLAKVKRQDERRWLSPVAMALAAIALIGGLGLAYLQVPKPQPSPDLVRNNNAQAPNRQQTNQVKQSSSGAGSPNVQTDGDVTITIDQSTGNTNLPAAKGSNKKAKQASR